MIKKTLVLSLALLLGACADDSSNNSSQSNDTGGNGGGSSANNDGIDRKALLTNLVDNVVLSKLGASSSPADGTLMAEANTLKQNVDSYCSAIGTGTQAETAALEKAQKQWRSVMGLWQQLQMASVGPLKLSLDKNRIYAWPENQTNSCLVYLLSVKNRSNNAFSVSGSTSQARGLGALEQSLFFPDLNYACSTNPPEKTTWDGLSDNDKKLALCNFSRAAAQDLTDRIKDVAVNWESGTTKADFIEAGNDSVQAFVDALFNLETLTKDRKLGTPTGLHSSCGASKVSCPESVESRLSSNSIENIRSNIKGFLAVFTGGDGKSLGFDDILEARIIREDDRKKLVDGMINKLKAIDTKLANFSGSLEQNVTGITQENCSNSFMSPGTTRTVEACALFGELKVITDLLKMDFTTIVNVEIPNNASGDGD